MNNKEIKVGEYIKDDVGLIFKVKKIQWYEREELYWYDGGFCAGCWSDQVKKHSSNIIDLIEVGDYVNEQLVDEKWYDYANKEMRFYNNGNLIGLEGHINSIVTKEQFENVEYKVEK